MSWNRPPSPPPSVLPSQYDSTETLSASRSFNTMSSPTPPDTSWMSRFQIHSTQIPKAYISPICGAGAGFASGIVTCPLDVIKTKLQAQGGFNRKNGGKYSRSNQMYRGILGTGRTIWREEGIRGMYRGLGPMLLGYLPTWAVYLTVYENTREFYFDQSGSWWLARCYSSLTAGACSTVLTNPIWVIKTRLMSQSTKAASDGMRAPWHYTSTLDAVRKMYRNEGLASFYSGLTPALLGLTHVAVQFPLYEYFKMKFTGYGMGDHPADEGSSHWAGITAATFLSKVCASTATYPHEVLRTRLQTQQRQHPAASPEGITHSGSMREPLDMKRGVTNSDGMAVTARYKGIIRTCKVILREEGWRAFYAGIGTNLVRAVPAAMVTMITYEWLQSAIHHAQDAGEEKKKKKKKERDQYASTSV